MSPPPLSTFGDLMPLVNFTLLAALILRVLWVSGDYNVGWRAWVRRRFGLHPTKHSVLVNDAPAACPAQDELDARIDRLAEHVDGLVEERNARIEALALRLDVAEAAVSEKILNCQRCLEIAVAQGNDQASTQARILAAAESRRIKDEIAGLRGALTAANARLDVLGGSLDEVAKAILAIRDEEPEAPPEAPPAPPKRPPGR